MRTRLAFAAATTLATALFVAPVQAQDKPALKPLDDSELSGVWGQALLDLTNTTLNGYDFSRLTLNADINLSASLSGLRLGTTGSTSDIDITTLNFGRSDAGDAKRTVAITDPYFEWVYSGSAAAGNRQVVGMRIGFGGIAGDVGLLMNTVSGSLSFTTTSGQVLSATGSRLTALTGCSGSCNLNQIGGVTAGTGAVDGASRDFFLSILKSAVSYPTTNSQLGASATAQAGFWLNWTDRLTALNTTGTVPPNVPKIGP
jgi:hypothetical protein